MYHAAFMVWRMMSGLMGVLALIYVAVGAAAYFGQDEQIFPRAQFELVEIDVSSFPHLQEQWLPTADGAKLHGLMVQTSPTVVAVARQAEKLVLVFPGNQHDGRAFARFIGNEVLANRATVVGFQHRGYGQSIGQPSMAALYADALHIFDTYTAELKPSTVYVLGYSLGSSVAAYLASQRPVAGVMLITPFTSIAAMAKEQYPIFPVDLLLRHPFPTLDLVRQIEAPITVIAAGEEELIPVDHAPQVAEAAGEQLKFFHMLEGALHGEVLDHVDFPAAVRALVDFPN